MHSMEIYWVMMRDSEEAHVLIILRPVRCSPMGIDTGGSKPSVVRSAITSHWVSPSWIVETMSVTSLVSL